MSGYGPSTLTAGDNIYLATGNSAKPTYAAPVNLSESVVKMAPDLSAIEGYFTDPHQPSLDSTDFDLGSGGVMVLPTMPGANPRLLIAAGKAGNMYLLDTTPANRVNLLATYAIGPCWCGPSFYQGADGVYRVVSSGGSSVIIWDIHTSNSAPQRSPRNSRSRSAAARTAVSSPASPRTGCSPARRSSWAVGRPTGPFRTLALYAIDPATGHILLQTPAGSWNNGASNANIVPTVANGHVYVGSTGQLQIFGLPTAGAPAASRRPRGRAPAPSPAGSGKWTRAG